MAVEESPGTIVRAFEVPLNHPGDPAVWKTLERCWNEAAMLANWIVQTCQRLDCVRLPGMTELPDFTFPDLYAMIRGRDCEKVGRKDKTKVLPVVAGVYPGADFFDGATGCIPAIIQKVTKKYGDERKEVLWLRRKHFATYDLFPWPIPRSAWKARFEDGKPVVSVALPGLGRVDLTLRGGAEFGRQMAQFRQLVSGDLPRKELVIRWQRCSESCHRPTMSMYGVPGRVMVKMVAELPQREKRGDRCLVLLTDPHAFWVAELDCRPAWVLNNDHYRQIAGRELACPPKKVQNDICRNFGEHAEYLRRLKRLSQDAKAERRLTKNRTKLQPKIEALGHKDQNRMATAMHEASAHLVQYALRQKVGEIFYIDLDKSFIPSAPWHDALSKLQAKCDAAGIKLYSASSLRSSGDEENAKLIDDITRDFPQQENDEKWLRIAKLRAMASMKIARSRSRKGSHRAVSAPPAI